jgi:hypothetical protein
MLRIQMRTESFYKDFPSRYLWDVLNADLKEIIKKQ